MEDQNNTNEVKVVTPDGQPIDTTQAYNIVSFQADGTIIATQGDDGAADDEGA